MRGRISDTPGLDARVALVAHLECQHGPAEPRAELLGLPRRHALLAERPPSAAGEDRSRGGRGRCCRPRRRRRSCRLPPARRPPPRRERLPRLRRRRERARRGAESPRRSRASETTRAPAITELGERPHLRKEAAGADAVHETRRVVDRDRPARGERGREGRGGLDLAGVDSSSTAPGRAGREAMPHERPPPPQGTRTASRVGKVLEDLEPDRSVAGDDGAVRHRVDEEALDSRIAVLGEDLPPSVDRHLDDRGRRDARPRRAWPAARDPARRPCTECRGAARSRPRPGPCCRRTRYRRRGTRDAGIGEGHRVARAAQLEGADRLEALELEPDLGGRLRRRGGSSGVRIAEPDTRARADLVEAHGAIGIRTSFARPGMPTRRSPAAGRAQTRRRGGLRRTRGSGRAPAPRAWP